MATAVENAGGASQAVASGSSVPAGNGASTSAAAGSSSAFNSAEDFIAFDFDDEEEAEESGDDNDLSDGPSRRPSPKAQGKKRKVDDDEDRRSGTKSNRDDASSRSGNAKSTSQSRKQERRQLARGTPWCVDVDFGRCRSAIEMLHDELIAFADWISPTQEEHETRRLVIDLIRRAIVGRWPDADVQPFGSQNTQLYMPQGDIDLVVISPQMERERREGVLRTMAAVLRRHNLATDVQVIAKAKVPIIKFVCTHGKLKVDISINQTNGLSTADFVCAWLDRCPSIRPLIMATKLLLSQRGMSEVFSGGLGSYSVICMVISHLQLHPKVQRGEMDPAFNLGILFLEFLELFGKNFGYDEVGISIAGLGGYFRKAAVGWKDDRRPFMLCIEDPQDPTNDIAKGSFGILSVRQVFGGAFDILTAALCQREMELQDGRAYDRWDDERDGKSSGKHKRFEVDEDEQARQALVNGARNGSSSSNTEKDPQSLLGTILGVNHEMDKARRDLSQLWHGGSLQKLAGRRPPPRSPEPVHRWERTREQRDERSNGRDASVQTTRDAGVQTMRKRRDAEEGPRKGTRGTPEIFIDKTSSKRQRRDEDDDLAQKAGRNAAAVADAISVPDSSYDSDGTNGIRAKHDSDDEAQNGADSRYTSTQSRKGAPQANGTSARRSRLDQFSRNAPQTYVDDDDDDDDVDADASTLASSSPEVPRRGISIKDVSKSSSSANGASADSARSSSSNSKSSRKAAYWASKGNAVGGVSSRDDDKADEDDGVLLNIHN